jgi:glucosylceramidase
MANDVFTFVRRIVFSCLAAVLLQPNLSAQQRGISVWLTNPDRSSLFKRQDSSPQFTTGTVALPRVELNPARKFQSMVGFGFALTGGSAQLLIRMAPEKRKAILNELFGSKANSIGLSYLRVTIGASDMNEGVYSYDDLPPGETDPNLARFSLAHDEADVIPVLKEILALDPQLHILGSPWSAPTWMKTNGNVKGGKLKPEFYAAYAQYFVRYIEGMRAHGIAIDAITIQNEPLNPNNTPSMVMEAPEENAFIKNNLGPAFQKAGIHTKIFLYDHNCDVPEYPLSILQDPAAAKYVDGSAFHLYGGKIEAMSKVHHAYPDKNVYFTEFMAEDLQHPDLMPVAEPVSGTVIGATRNWSRMVLLWNLAADSHFNPHTNDGGCGICQGAITIDGDAVTRNLAYYVIAHFAKFVRPGSVRIASSGPETLPNVAFQTPDNQTVAVVANTSASPQTFTLAEAGRFATVTLKAGAVATYIW